MRRRLIPAVLLCSALAVSFAGAQGIGGLLGQEPDLPSVASAQPYTGAFRFCRIRFRNWLQGDGSGWYVDYPRADENLSTRLAEVTRTPMTYDVTGAPLSVVLTLTDPELFGCPFIMMTEPGGAYFDEEEAKQLRTYLLKGGFLWADDFWGSQAWRSWATQVAKVFSPADYPIVDLSIDHPIFHTLFDVQRFPQIPNVGLWVSSHETSERGSDSAQAHARAIFDERGRMMMLMTFNTDFGDAYERESESPDYFQHHSIPAYAIGVNLLLYAMSH